MAELSNIISVQLRTGGALAGKFNINATAIISATNGVLNSANRTKKYRNLRGVIEDFGIGSAESDFATTYFAQSPNPVSAGGYLIIGYHRAADEEVPEQPSQILGGQLSTTVIRQLRQITDGGFVINAGDADVTVSGLNFALINTLADVVEVLDTSNLRTIIDISLENGRIKIVAKRGLVLKPKDSDNTPVASLLKLTEDAIAIPAQDAQTLTAETIRTGIDECFKSARFGGFVTIDKHTDDDILAISDYAQASSILFYEPFADEENLKIAETNIVFKIRNALNTNTRMRFATNRKASVAEMAKTHNVIFTGENTTQTANLDEYATIEPETMTEDNLTNAEKLGLDVYTTIRGIPKNISSGANDWTDNRYNLTALIDDLQVELFNLLASTATKIGLTTRGVEQLTARANQTLQRYVVNGFLAGGSWNLPDRFGNEDTFNTNIEKFGFYVLARPLSSQSQKDREERKAPPLQIAIKSASAIHSADVILNFNE